MQHNIAFYLTVSCLPFLDGSSVASTPPYGYTARAERERTDGQTNIRMYVCTDRQRYAGGYYDSLSDATYCMYIHTYVRTSLQMHPQQHDLNTSV